MRLHVRLLVADFPRMLAFYRDTLGLAVGWSDDQHYADLKAGDPTLALYRRQGMEMTDWGIRVAHFRDPEGNLIEVNQPLVR